MLILALCLLLVLSSFHFTNASKTTPYTPIDSILINCGASSPEVSQDNRIWDGDAKSNFCSFHTQISQPSKASQQKSVPRIPYMTAQIIHSKLTCAFPVLPGPKFIRLHFYPDTYSGQNTSTSFFTVTANNYTLLSNFSAYLTVAAAHPPLDYLVKEFIVTVWDNQQLNITFNPSPNSFSFINGIEIVSMPNTLYTKDMDNPFVNSDTFFHFDNTTSLETVYRLNVGGGFVSGVNDTGMFRTWYDDSNYIFDEAYGIVHEWRNDVTIKYTKDTPAYTAPAVVYITKRTMGNESDVNLKYNLTWLFPVNSGFNYLLRLHFCETEELINEENPRVFSIFINNMTAEHEADVIHWSGGNDIPVYRDYVVFVPERSHGKQDLWLALHPDIMSSPYTDAILNGLEIFKLNKSNGNLAGPNPELELVPTATEQHPVSGEGAKGKGSSLVAAIVGAGLGVIFTFSLLFFFGHRYKGKAKDASNTKHELFWLSFSYTSSSTAAAALSLPTDLCRKFSITEIKAATRNFNDQNVIGTGGFGTVYKGNIQNGFIPVAIKRLDSSSKQGTREFHAEIEMLSKLRHLHLVSLIGYCDGEGEMILVYEYMPHGTLRDHLYKTKNHPLPWKQRLQICIGAARGLHYLHAEYIHTIIHRDVKTTNILLNEKWIAKVSDFGLSKVVLDQDVSTLVKGTWGYLDPEYARYQQLTEKSDVYSFGVVLFEVLCARKALNQNLEYEEMNLAYWAQKCIQNGNIYEIIDPCLMGKIAPECFNKFVEIAYSCVRNKGIDRPNMRDVMGELEFALELQEVADAEKMAMSPNGEVVYPEVSFVVAQCVDNVYEAELDLSGSTTFETSATKATFHMM